MKIEGWDKLKDYSICFDGEVLICSNAKICLNYPITPALLYQAQFGQTKLHKHIIRVDIYESNAVDIFVTNVHKKTIKKYTTTLNKLDTKYPGSFVVSIRKRIGSVVKYQLIFP